MTFQHVFIFETFLFLCGHRTKQALPRDSIVDELHLKNQYLQGKLQALENQLPRDNLSRPSVSLSFFII